MSSSSPGSAAKSSAPAHVLCALIHLAMSGAVTWPLALSPATRVTSLGDPLLNAWILDWGRWALFHQIGDFFQATMFWPHADSLVYGEHMIAPAILALPFGLFTGSAAAVHNLSLMQACFFSALSAHVLAAHWFRSPRAALVAGLAYGFAPYRVSQILHLQLVHGEFLPLMILAVERIVRQGDRRWMWLLFASAAGQALTSWYWAVYTAVFGGGWIAIRLLTERRTIGRAEIVRIALPLAVAVAVVAPVAWPYAELSRKNVLFRPGGNDLGLAASPADFLRPHARMPLAAAARAFDDAEEERQTKESGEDTFSERTLFPGCIPAALLLTACALALRRRGRELGESRSDTTRPPFPLAACLAMTGAAVLLSFGSGGDGAVPLPHALLELVLPSAGSMRVPARWVFPALLGLALLSAYVVERFGKSENRRLRIAASVLPVLLVLESIPLPARYETIPGEPREVDLWLAEQPWPSPVIELPVEIAGHNLALIYSTWHRQPLVNGNNGYHPPGQIALFRAANTFPSAESAEAIRGTGVRFVILNNDLPAKIVSGIAGSLSPPEGPPLPILAIGENLVIDLGANSADAAR